MMRASLCLCVTLFVSSVHARFSPLEALSCSVETAEGIILPCSSSFAYKETCKLPDAKTRKDSSTSSSSSPLVEREEEEEEGITLREKVITSANSVIDVHFPLWQTRRSAVVVMRVQHQQQQRRWSWRCLVMMVVTNEPGNVTLRDLTLPHGPYEVRVFKQAEGKRQLGGQIRVKQLSRRFSVPSRVRRWRAPLSRQRRHKELGGRLHVATQDLILRNLGNDEQEEEPITAHDSSVSNGGGKYVGKGREGSSYCLCCKCFQFHLDYDENKAVLTFSYTLNNTCDEACSVVNVQLYRDNTSGTEQQCESGEPMLLLNGVERIGLDKNVTEGPIRYRNIGHGCYFVELKPQMYRMPERTRLFWARPAINVTDMNAWSTVFFLDPDPDRRSMSVRWSVSEAYNFTAYQLTIHHHPSLRINCTGRAIYPNMTVIPPHERLITSKPEYIFHNLSSGWYCARVTPQDDRCPLDGCQVLSSPPRRLDEPAPSWGCEHDAGGTGDCDKGGALRLILLVVGCVLGALVTGVTVAWILLHTWPTLSHMFSSSHYSPVPLRMEGGKAGVAHRQLVLVVWTLQGPSGAAMGPIVMAFKTLLRTYANCEVYDYLELSSLPEKQQMRLLSSPTAWLDSILANHSVKILIVATEGAWQRQLEWKQLAPPTRPRQENGLVSSPANAHDQVLFPYLLRRLHDQPELAGNYSRLFHVRFSDVSDASVELTHIVSLKRYRIPEHLQSLAVSLHGGPSTASFEEPKEEQLTDLRTALASHPEFCSHSDGRNSPQWPGLVNGGQLKAINIANGCVKSSEVSISSPSPVVNGSAKPGVSDRGSTT